MVKVSSSIPIGAGKRISVFRSVYYEKKLAVPLCVGPIGLENKILPVFPLVKITNQNSEKGTRLPEWIKVLYITPALVFSGALESTVRSPARARYFMFVFFFFFFSFSNKEAFLSAYGTKFSILVDDLVWVAITRGHTGD